MADKPTLALSVQQPWSWLIVNGHKDVENRSWSTKIRGRVFIHAGLKQDYDAYDGDPANRPLELYIVDKISFEAITEWDQLPIAKYLGAIIGEVTIVDCVTESGNQWFEGPYGFLLKDPVAYDTPIRCPGRLGFWPVAPVGA